MQPSEISERSRRATEFRQYMTVRSFGTDVQAGPAGQRGKSSRKSQKTGAPYIGRSGRVRLLVVNGTPMNAFGEVLLRPAPPIVPACGARLPDEDFQDRSPEGMSA